MLPRTGILDLDLTAGKVDQLVRAHQAFVRGTRRNGHVGDEMQRARRRELGERGRMLEPGNAQAHGLAVFVNDRPLLGRVRIGGVVRHPIHRVLGEQLQPLVEPPLVDERRLLVDKLLDLRQHGSDMSRRHSR